ncbi:MAG: hypothetical protein ACK6D3_05900 [Planctomycetaceae bacterium]
MLGPLLALCLVWVGVGCSQPAAETARENAAAEEPARADEEAPRKKSTKSKGTTRKAEQRKGIPKDVWPEVWLDRPSEVASERGPGLGGAGEAPAKGTGAAATTAANTPATTTPASPPGTEPSASTAASPTAGSGGSANWIALLGAEDFADESKAIRSNLTAKLQSVGTFNGAYREIQVDAAVLAALAQIAPDYSDAPSWKKNALLVRDVAAELGRESNSVGDKFYKPSREAFDKLDSLLSGSVPPGLEAGPPKMQFVNIAPRYPLMKRFERAQNYLKGSVNNADLLKKEADKVQREAGVIALLAEVILSEGYDSSDDDLYRELVSGVREGALKVVAAARDQEFDAYTAGLDLMYKSCTKCHSEFKNN